MAVRQILYASQVPRPISEQTCREILNSSRRNNERDGISGLLVYISNGTFLQVLEGSDAAVEDAMQRIIADIRHVDIAVLVDKWSRESQFAEWSMGFKTLETDELADLEGFKSVRNVDDLSDLFKVRDEIFGVMRAIYNANARF